MKLVDFEGDIYLQDEAFSSQEAQEQMKGDIKYQRDGRVDSLSAKIILERFLAK
jgi:putative Holliday junction resolvase